MESTDSFRKIEYSSSRWTIVKIKRQSFSMFKQKEQEFRESDMSPGKTQV